jgi:hypothetical protein
MELFYIPASGQVIYGPQLQQNTGFPPTTDVSVLALNGIYKVNQTPNPCDPLLYQATPVYTVNGDYADQTWVATPLDLTTAKYNGSWEVKNTAIAEETDIVSQSQVSNEILTAVTGQDIMDRPTRFQTVLEAMAVVSNNLDANLNAIDAATSVDEIDSVVHQPSGTIVTGRGGAGPDDLHPSYFTVLTNLPPGVGEPELEIYIPGTDTVIPYNPGLPAPYKFDSMGNCYNTGDYRTTIRVAATGQVLSTVTPAFGPIAPIEWTYNPTIPSLGGGSSHSA